MASPELQEGEEGDMLLLLLCDCSMQKKRPEEDVGLVFPGQRAAPKEGVVDSLR